MRLGADRRAKLANEDDTSEEDRARLLKEAGEMADLADHKDFKETIGDLRITWLAARKVPEVV